MASYFLAPSLVKLRAEIDKRWPKRSKKSDGWIGDASHSARKSDHNPAWSASGKSRGIVRAIDVTSSGIDANDVIRELMQDPRTYYIIHKGRIRSRTYDFANRRYTGSNPHNSHIHVSVLSTERAGFGTQAWGIVKAAVAKPLTRKISAAKVRAAFRTASKGGVSSKVTHAKAIQTMLKKKGCDPGKADGRIGPATFRAFRQFERRQDFKYADGIPSSRGLVVLFKGAKVPTRIVK